MKRGIDMHLGKDNLLFDVCAHLNKGINYFAAVYHNGAIIVTGGSDEDTRRMKAVHRYLIAEDRWLTDES